MKIKASLLLLAALLGAVAAPAKEVARVPAPEGVLPVVITEMTLLGNSANAVTDFHRLALEFERMAEERKWPVKIAAERFAANTTDYLTTLNISLMPLREETPGEYEYRGWTTLWVNGKEHDFKIIIVRYKYRLGEQMDDRVEKLFRAVAHATADKIEPLLFPDLKKEEKK